MVSFLSGNLGDTESSLMTGRPIRDGSEKPGQGCPACGRTAIGESHHLPRRNAKRTKNGDLNEKFFLRL